MYSKLKNFFTKIILSKNICWKIDWKPLLKQLKHQNAKIINFVLPMYLVFFDHKFKSKTKLRQN